MVVGGMGSRETDDRSVGAFAWERRTAIGVNWFDGTSTQFVYTSCDIADNISSSPCHIPSLSQRDARLNSNARKRKAMTSTLTSTTVTQITASLSPPARHPPARLRDLRLIPRRRRWHQTLPLGNRQGQRRSSTVQPQTQWASHPARPSAHAMSPLHTRRIDLLEL
jgi:hypothetical protein